MKPITLTNAKTTMMMYESFAPRPSPKRKLIHCAPVMALLLRIHAARNTKTKTWFHTGQSHGIQALLRPYTNKIMTVHMVPLMSHMPEALDNPSMYHFMVLPPRK